MGDAEYFSLSERKDTRIAKAEREKKKKKKKTGAEPRADPARAGFDGRTRAKIERPEIGP